jgi:hypothetical protein
MEGQKEMNSNNSPRHNPPSIPQTALYFAVGILVLACIVLAVRMFGLVNDVSAVRSDISLVTQLSENSSTATAASIKTIDGKLRTMNDAREQDSKMLLENLTKILEDAAKDREKSDELTAATFKSIGNQVKSLTNLIEMEAKLREKDIADLRAEIKKLREDPGVGKNLTPILELDGHHGEEVYSNFVHFKKAVTPEKTIVKAVKDLHESILYSGVFKDAEPELQPWGDDGKVAVDNDGKPLKIAKHWRFGFPKSNPKKFSESVLKPGGKNIAWLVAVQVYVNGARLIWSRPPSEAQLKTVGPKLEALARAVGHEPGEGCYFHDSKYYVFKP